MLKSRTGAHAWEEDNAGMGSTDSFEADFDACVARLNEARGRLLQDVRHLDGHDLVQRRRGGWSVGEVLRHVADSEVSYAQAVGFLRSQDAASASASDDDVASTGAIVLTLERTRRALLDAIDGVDEDTFYDLRPLGRQQYSVLSVLENVAAHDDEHREQIAKTLGES